MAAGWLMCLLAMVMMGRCGLAGRSSCSLASAM